MPLGDIVSLSFYVCVFSVAAINFALLFGRCLL